MTNALHRFGLIVGVLVASVATIPAVWADPCVPTQDLYSQQISYLGPDGLKIYIPNGPCAAIPRAVIVVVTSAPADVTNLPSGAAEIVNGGTTADASVTQLISVLTGAQKMAGAAPGTHVFDLVTPTDTADQVNTALTTAQNIIINSNTTTKSGVIIFLHNGPRNQSVDATLTALASTSIVVVVNAGDAEGDHPTPTFLQYSTNTLCDAHTTDAPLSACVAGYDKNGVLPGSNYGVVSVGAPGSQIVAMNSDGTYTTISGSAPATLLAGAGIADALNAATKVLVSVPPSGGGLGVGGGSGGIHGHSLATQPTTSQPTYIYRTPTAAQVYVASLAAKTPMQDYRTAAGGILDVSRLADLLKNPLASTMERIGTRVAAWAARGVDAALGVEDAWAAPVGDIKNPPQNSAMIKDQVGDISVKGPVKGVPTLEILRYCTADSCTATELQNGVVEWCEATVPSGATSPITPTPASGGSCQPGTTVSKPLPTYTMSIIPSTFFSTTLKPGLYGLRLTVTDTTGTATSLVRFTAEKANWVKTVNAPIYGTPTLADINGDGKLDIVVGTAENQGQVIAVDAATGTEVFHSSQVNGPIVASVAVLDLDKNDVIPNIVAGLNKEGVNSLVEFDPAVSNSPVSGVQIGGVLSPPVVITPFQAETATWVDTFVVMNNLGQLYWFKSTVGSGLTQIVDTAHPTQNINCANDATGASPLGGPPCSTNPQVNREIAPALVRPTYDVYYGQGYVPGTPNGTYRLLTADAAYPTFTGEVTMEQQVGPPYEGPYGVFLGTQHADNLGPLAFVNGDPPPGSLPLTPSAQCLTNFGPSYVIAAQAKLDKSAACLANPSPATCPNDGSVVGALLMLETFSIDPANPWAKNPDGSDMVSPLIDDYVGGNSKPAMTLLGPGGTAAFFVTGASGTLYKIQYNGTTGHVELAWAAKPESWQGAGITAQPSVIDIQGTGNFCVLTKTTAGLTLAFDAMTGQQVYVMGGEVKFPRGGILPSNPSDNCYLSEKNNATYLFHKWDKTQIATCASPQVVYDNAAGGAMQLLTLTGTGPTVLMSRTLNVPSGMGARLTVPAPAGLWQRALAALRSAFRITDTAIADSDTVIPYVLETNGGSSPVTFAASTKQVTFALVDDKQQPIKEHRCVTVTHQPSIGFTLEGVPPFAQCVPNQQNPGKLSCTVLDGQGTTDPNGQITMLLNGGQEASADDPTQLNWEKPVAYTVTVDDQACQLPGVSAAVAGSGAAPTITTIALPLKTTQAPTISITTKASGGVIITTGSLQVNQVESGLGASGEKSDSTESDGTITTNGTATTE